MKLENHDKLIQLTKDILHWEVQESGRRIDFCQHLADGLYDQAESIKHMIESDIGEMMIERQRMEEIFAEAWIALYFVKKKYSLAMTSENLQLMIDEHCEFLSKQYEVAPNVSGNKTEVAEQVEEVDYSTMEF